MVRCNYIIASTKIYSQVQKCLSASISNHPDDRKTGAAPLEAAPALSYFASRSYICFCSSSFLYLISAFSAASRKRTFARSGKDRAREE